MEHLVCCCHTGPKRGKCVCDEKTWTSKCQCNKGYIGTACQCPDTNDECMATTGVSQLLSFIFQFNGTYPWNLLCKRKVIHSHSLCNVSEYAPIQPSHTAVSPQQNCRPGIGGSHFFISWIHKKEHNRTTNYKCVQSHLYFKNQMSRADVNVAPSIEDQIQWTSIEFVYSL